MTKRRSLYMVGSTLTIDHLPPEIWLLISRLLQTSDLHSLCLTNRRLYLTIVADEIWKKRCYDRWIIQENLDILADNDYDPIPVCQWHSYYLQRAKWENKIFSLLWELTMETQPQAFREKYFHILQFEHHKLATFLHRIIKQGYIPDKRRLDLLTYANYLLKNIRHKYVFPLFYPMNATELKDLNTMASRDAEMIYLRLSAIDTSFYDLLDSREFVLNGICSSLLHRYKKIEKFLELRPVDRVSKLISMSTDYLDCFSQLSDIEDQMGDRDGERELHREDFMLLRVYSRESRGYKTIILAMIQTIAKRYNVESYLARDHLVVTEPDFPGGQAFVTVNEDFQPYIFNKDDLISVWSSNYPNSANFETAALPALLEPISIQHLLTEFFRELLRCKPRPFEDYPNRAHGLRDMFPYGKVEVPRDVTMYFAFIFDLFDAMFESGMTSLRGQMLRDLLNYVNANNFGDLNIIIGQNALEEPNDCWCNKRDYVLLDDDDKIGYFFQDIETQDTLCALNQYKVDGKVFITTIDILGDIRVRLAEGLMPFRGDCDKLWGSISPVVPRTDWGLFFKGYDSEKQRMQLSAYTQERLFDLIDK
ncbi:SCF ubiquitin ligase complex subunit MDM30 [Saccharomyces eubayanus]|uniref:SCF ubiquitin ligase complex subunit MDM30 n=1 Tax=Saccharomyces eubayanus TaxID=1080349 RepID=UPI0006C376E0|nr:MDM30-like protein [Saccharomyces eubayanus]KOG98040.1 MDM30-like protein [Saccharomyces eubayanus]